MSAWLETWSSVFSNHPALRTAIAFAHVGGLLAGGGLAISADRALLRLLRAPQTIAERARALRTLDTSHPLIIGSLALVMLSGLALVGADLDTFISSKIFWLKIGLTLLLVINGGVLVQQERRVLGGDSSAWPRLRGVALASLALWFSITLLGAALPNLG